MNWLRWWVIRPYLKDVFASIVAWSVFYESQSRKLASNAYTDAGGWGADPLTTGDADGLTPKNQSSIFWYHLGRMRAFREIRIGANALDTHTRERFRWQNRR